MSTIRHLVRDSQRVVPTCTECGCRLEQRDSGMWMHYGTQIPNTFVDADSRGHKCTLLWHGGVIHMITPKGPHIEFHQIY